MSQNIREMIAAGHPHAQAVAASLANADRHPRAAYGGGIRGYAGGGTLPYGEEPASRQSWIDNLDQIREEVGQTTFAPSVGMPLHNLGKQLKVIHPLLGDRRGGGIRGYDDGGATALGQPQGIAPTSGTMNPIVQQQIQRYSAMSPEQLQELAVALGPTQQGQLVQRILQQKRFMPQPVPQQSIAPQQQPVMRRGGSIPHMQGGGNPLGVSMGMADPPWERSQMRVQPSTGFLLGATPGRADLVKAQPPAGSYVWPADVLAGLGEGNGLAGANILEKALATGPKGTKLPPGRRGPGVPIPRAPAPFTGSYMAPPAASGGRANDHGGAVDIMAAHGELITPPHIAQMWGRGNMKKGHDLFDKAVIHFRKDHIKDLQHLRGPKKS